MGTLGPSRPPEPNAACPQDPAGSAGTGTLDRHLSVPDSQQLQEKEQLAHSSDLTRRLPKVIVTSCHNPQLSLTHQPVSPPCFLAQPAKSEAYGVPFLELLTSKIGV